jgi:hypothetical protein
MARDDEIERRMLNWARWKTGSGNIGLGFGCASMWNSVRVDCAGSREAVIPTNAVEADQTDGAINTLPEFLRDTVHVMYLSDDPIRVKAQRLGCATSTVHSRVSDAHARILAWVAERERIAHAKREQLAQDHDRARLVALGAAAHVVLPTVKGKRRK